MILVSQIAFPRWNVTNSCHKLLSPSVISLSVTYSSHIGGTFPYLGVSKNYLKIISTKYLNRWDSVKKRYAWLLTVFLSKVTSSVLTDKNSKLIVSLFSLLLSLFNNVGFGMILVALLSSLINVTVYRMIYRRTSKFSKGGNDKTGCHIRRRENRLSVHYP